jgi:hypothetical protein
MERRRVSDQPVSTAATSASGAALGSLVQIQYPGLQFTVTTISDVNPKLSRVYVANGCLIGGRAYWAKNGKSCWAATGQSRLVIPTDEVIDWANQNPGGIPRRGLGI